MKIAASTIQPIVREPGKSGAARGHLKETSKEPKAADAGAPKPAPPGLERALARLQSLPERNAGQANAMERISRNIARYAQTQALGAPPVVTPAQTPDANATAVAPDSGSAASV